MTILWLAFEGTWHVLLAGLILGAGLPAVFALGVRSLSLGSGGPGQRPSLLGRITAGVCFTVVLLAVLAGIATIIAPGLGVLLVFDGNIRVFPGRCPLHRRRPPPVGGGLLMLLVGGAPQISRPG